MSIKCSIMGHRFGETEVEREREEDGTEVVITITELESCTRCGETRIVSENKEVTTMEAPDDGGAVTGSGAADSPAATDGETVTDDAPGGRDAEFVDDAADEAATQAEARTEETTIPDAESGRAATADDAGDDAVIIDDGAEVESGSDRDGSATEADGDGSAAEADRESAADADDGTAADDRDRGEWPEEPEGVGAAERAGETAEVEILESGADDESPSDDEATGTGDAETAAAAVGEAPAPEADAATAAGTDAVGGAGQSDATAETGAAAGETSVEPDDSAGSWPAESADSSANADSFGDWPEETKRDEPLDSPASAPTLDGGDSPTVTVPEGMFKCSECGYTTEADSSSLRAGDFCPECHRGTLAQREDPVEE